MHETEEDILEFKKLLGASAHSAGPNVKKALQIPQKMLKAEQILRHLQGLHTFTFATSTSNGSPQITLTKTLFYRTRFYIPTIRNALRTRHVMHQPNVSLASYQGDDFALIINGRAEIIDPEVEEQQEEFQIVEEIHRGYSDDTPGDWKKGIYLQVRPIHFYSYASDPKSYPTFAERRKSETAQSNQA